MTEITYTRQGDYNLPNLLPPQEEPVPHGKYALLRKKFLKEHRRVTYTNLLTSGRLTSHLAEIQQTAQRRMEEIVAQMAKSRGRDGGTESQRPDEMGADDEQPAERGGGNGAGGADLQLKEEPEESAGGDDSSLRFWMKSRSWPSSPTRMMTSSTRNSRSSFSSRFTATFRNGRNI